ncbi:DUF4363 family protein [Cytobacillus gottheilii]|uniref:DUF4363 family protein n=1 Tax=Cytobacillus gottheilii TaxID=859144 RepID=A0ABX8FDW0_9BACI|nr:DUF4363 family protein [Cytobacillus gottheilii]QVY62117.1 DUF4363 family protein [Cytobacillus gottheilii]
MNKILVYISLLLLLTSCENNTGGDVFFKQINDIENGLEEPNWNEIMLKTKELKKIYKKNRWKIQLLGDEEEYEELYKSINKLIAATKEKDPINVRIELATTHTLIEDIYSL